MANHTLSVTFSDADEKAWAFVLGMTNAGRSGDDQLSDVDALIALRLDELSQGARSTFAQRPAFAEFKAKLIEKLDTASDQDVDAIAQAAKVPGPTKQAAVAGNNGKKP